MKPVRIGISGASGRMGRKLIEAAYGFNQPKLVAALEHSENSMLGINAAFLAEQVTPNKTAHRKNILLSDTFDPESVDVFIDFSTPAAAVELSKKCRKHNIAMVIGVTGFSEAEKKELQAASKDIPLLMSPNMNVGVLSMFDIVRQAASLFKNSDVEICESHHRNKKDAPSGTALRIGEIIAEARGVSFEDVAVFNRKRKGNTRGENEIGFSEIRGGDIIGEHRVIFASHGEQFEIIHRSTNRTTYAVGAIFAARRLVDQPAGLYSMEDIFKLPLKNS